MQNIVSLLCDTVNVLSPFFSLFMFEFNHVLSFPGSACYHAEELGLLVRDLFSIFFFFCFFSFPLDRPTDPKSGNAFDSKKVNGLRGSTSKQHTINLVPWAFSMAWEGKRSWAKVEHTVIYVLGQYSKRYRASFILQVNVKNIFKKGRLMAV